MTDKKHQIDQLIDGAAPGVSVFTISDDGEIVPLGEGQGDLAGMLRAVFNVEPERTPEELEFIAQCDAPLTDGERRVFAAFHTQLRQVFADMREDTSKDHFRISARGNRFARYLIEETQTLPEDAAFRDVTLATFVAFFARFQ